MVPSKSAIFIYVFLNVSFLQLAIKKNTLHQILHSSLEIIFKNVGFFSNCPCWDKHDEQISKMTLPSYTYFNPHSKKLLSQTLPKLFTICHVVCFWYRIFIYMNLKISPSMRSLGSPLNNTPQDLTILATVVCVDCNFHYFILPL